MCNHKSLYIQTAILVLIVLSWGSITSALPLSQQDNSAQKQEARSYTVHSATSEIKVDGVLNEPAWENAATGDLPYEWLPGDNIPAPVDTEFLVTFSQSHLYIGMRCFDSNPAQIRAHLMDRDDTDILIQDDHISILIDPFNDERRGFQFRVNPLGVQADANFSELEGYEDFSWDAIWDSAGKITDWGYAIEIAIPFNQLRFPAGSDIQTWGFSMERSYPRSVRHRMTSHRRERNRNCLLCQMNKITGFQGMKTGLNLEIDPTLTANRTDSRDNLPDGKMIAGDENIDPGVTFRWGITPNLILNATLNPDFSQVEADVAQLEVNTRFAIRYPEKRPFFLEGADFFLTPIEAVFTRTVADPEGGLKFTGKIGRNAFGIFGTYDNINNFLIPSNQGSRSASNDQNITGGVFRFRRDVGQNSAFGVLYTGRNGSDYFNHVAGVDGFFRLSSTKTLSFQLLHSETDYPQSTAWDFGQKEEAFSGNALNINFTHNSRDWLYAFSYRDFSPDFRADFGYVPRVDIRRASGTLGRTFWGTRDDWFSRITFQVNGYALYDYDNQLTDRHFDLHTIYMGPLQSTAIIALINDREFYAGENYDLNSGVLFTEIKPASGLRFSLTGIYGDAVDYNNARKAGSVVLNPFAELSLGRHLNINLQHNFQRLAQEGDKIFHANLSQLRLIYNFNVRTFVRLILQYLDISRSVDLYVFPVTPKTQTIFTQFLFSYKLNPQTVLFIGYSDNSLGYTGIDITQQNRTFFMKIGYAWLK